MHVDPVVGTRQTPADIPILKAPYLMLMLGHNRKVTDTVVATPCVLSSASCLPQATKPSVGSAYLASQRPPPAANTPWYLRSSEQALCQTYVAIQL